MRITRFSLMVFSLLLFFGGIHFSNQTEAQSDVNILCFIQNGFGQSYYVNKDIMESYNWTITTASTSSFVVGCKNFGKNVTDTYADVFVSNITDDDLSSYDCIFVPSGGHWSNVIAVSRILEIIKTAHEEGILVAGICTGMIVLANADILEEVEVAYNIHATTWMDFAGANMTNLPVVSDQGIITGGFGGGVGSGPEGAPNEAFCEKIKDEIEIQRSQQATIDIQTFTIMIITLSIVSIAMIKWSKSKN
ncbi:MAG: DJ-1/PfpI family protein [Candidatus Heimdallarchaeaceae archaeon]